MNRKMSLSGSFLKLRKFEGIPLVAIKPKMKFNKTVSI